MTCQPPHQQLLHSCAYLHVVFLSSQLVVTLLFVRLQRMQLLEMVEEAGRRSWQRIKVIEELKDLEKSLRLYSGASHRRGGVRGGGRDRVKVCVPHAPQL